MSIRTELVTSKEEFKRLEAAWNTLLGECERSTVFSGWEWMYTWWEVFHDQFTRELYILCVYDDQELIGIAPLQIIKKYPYSFMLGKKLQFIGRGEASDDQIMSVFHDFIISPNRDADVCSAITEFLIKNKKDWDYADFPYLLKDALILECFSQPNSPLVRYKKESGLRFFIPKTEGFESYQSSMGNRWAKMLRKKSRLIERDGEVSVTTTETPESIDDALQLLARMHGSRWVERIGSNIFDSHRFYQFHSQILKRLVVQGKAYIKTIHFNDQPLASYYAFSDKGQEHYYQSGFYPELANKYSPLFLLVCKQIGLVNEKNKLFDFMYSEEESCYKKAQYACDTESMYRVMWAPKKFRLDVFNALRKTNQLYILVCDKMDSLQQLLFKALKKKNKNGK